MTFVSVLSVFGSNGAENKSDKFQKLFYDGLVAALGIYASDVDAVVATSAPMPALTETKKYGTALIHPLSSGAPLRALFQPELHQFQTAFEEAVAEAVDAVGSGVAVVVVVYAGEVLHSTGEWLLADSTFSGEQLHMWLDSNAAAAWQPEIQKLTTAPSGTEPINIVVCTPSAGAKTRWPMPTTPGGSTQLVMLSKSRRLPVRLQTAASWRANGKLLAAPSNATAFEALHALSDELARLHWEHQSKLLMEVEQEFTLAQRSFRDAPPALYLLPSGHGGVQTQACGLFVVQGVNVLLGSAFADNKPPQWWQLVRSLDRLDTAVFPDWSAASIQSYRFLTKHLLHATSGTYSANWLGCLFTPAPIEPGVESPLLLTPPTTATVTVDPHRLRHLSAQSEQTRLFYKIGVGELSLRYLGSSVGVLLVWHSAAGGGKVRSAVPLTIFLPVVHSLEASVLPASLLAGLVRMLRKVPEITGEGNNVTITATPIKRTTMASTGAKPPGAASKTVNSTTPIQTHVNGTLRNATPASAKPLASKSAPTRTPTSRVPATRTAAPSRTVPSTPPKPKTTTTTPRPIASATHHTTTTTTTPRDRAPHPTTTRSSTAGAKTTTALAKKSPAEKRPTPASKTEAKLAEHAAKVAKATAEKPGHEIKYAPAGRPSNLPPRRKVGEKTVMEELNELPEVMKTPATDSLAEIVKQQHLSRETEEEVSYPDSLHAEETETKEATMTAAEAEPSKYAVGVEHHEVPAFHEDFAMPAITENHGLATPEVDYSKSPVGVGPGAVQHQEGPKGSSEFPIESLPAKLPAGAVNDEELEMKVSTSPVDRTLVIGSEADEHHEEFVTSKSLATETTLKSPTGMKFEMSPSTDEHHDEFHAHEVESKSPFHEETSEPPADMESAILNAGVEHHEDFEEPRVTELESKSPYHEEISKSSAVIEFSMLPGVPGHHEDFEILKPPVDDGVPTTPTATDYFTKPNDAKHNEELGVSNLECRLREEISKSSAAMEFTTPAGTMSIPPDDEECEIPHETGHQENLQKLGSPSHEEVLRSPTGMQFAMPTDIKLSTSPTDEECVAYHGAGHEEDLGEARSPMHEEVSRSPAGMQFAMPTDMKLSTSPSDEECVAHHGAGHEEDLGEARSPVHEEVSRSPAGMQFAMPTDMKLSTSPTETEHVVHHEGGHHEGLEGLKLPDFESKPVFPEENLGSSGMLFTLPSDDASLHEVSDTLKGYEVECKSVSRSPGLDRSPETGFALSSLGDHTMGVTGFQEQSHLQPQATATDDEFPVHEINVGGGKVIPEVTDRVDLIEYPPENMPPIHADLMYQLQKDYTCQPADSTTYDGPRIGLMDVAAGRPVEENVHSPSSEVSNSSVIHTEAAPIPPGFIPEVVSSTSFSAIAASPNSGAPSGFSSQHPLLYSQHQSESFEGEEEEGAKAKIEASFHQKSPTVAVGGTGDMAVPSSKSPASSQRDEANGLLELKSGDFAKEAGSSEKPVGSSDGGSAVAFDPLTQWGPPQGMPAPVLPSRTTLGRPSRPTTARSAAPGMKAPAPSAASKAPETLPPGSPIHLDVIWVPGYIIRVPFAMATQFFTQVRARIYVLSGECLHPITGEALIAGISKWKPEEREAVMKMSGGRGVEGINVVPTDEPLEWVRWLRRSSGGSGDGNGTGEERLQAVGVTVHSSATLCDIHFSDNGIEITCPGTQLPV